nr:Uncharacterized protein conserved in bacteria [Streptococcus thermophilus]
MSRRPARAVIAAATALSLTTATVQSADAAPLEISALPQQDVVINGVKVPMPAALLAVAGITAALGGLSTFIVQVIINAAAGQKDGFGPGGSSGKPKKAAPQAEYLNRFDFSEGNDDNKIGGLSGIELVEQDRYIAISDDKNEHGPIRAYYFKTTDGGKTFTEDGMVTFTQADGGKYTDYLDPEEIRLLPNGNYLWTTEGAADKGKYIAPQIIESTPDGKEVRRIDAPAHHAPDEKGTKGVHDNKGPEAMAVLADGKTMITINEDALAQDGPENSDTHSSLARITVYDVNSGKAIKEHAVRVSPGRGVTSLLADDNGNLFMLERGFDEDTETNMAQIYTLNLKGADDVLGTEALSGMEKTASKTLIFDFDKRKPHPDNVEGLAWGPKNAAANGGRSMVVVTDDNFNDSQSTLMHLLAVR